MSERICVYGHGESEHQGGGGKICFHDPDPENEDSVLCECMDFRVAETERTAE